MTPTQARILKLVKGAGRCGAYASTIGFLAWGRKGKDPNYYVRPACKVLYALKAKGLVLTLLSDDYTPTRWIATEGNPEPI